MTAPIGDPEIKIGGFAHILVTAQVAYVAEIAALERMKDILGMASKYLTGALEKEPWVRDESRYRNSGIVYPVVAAEQVIGHERSIGPWQDVRVQGIHLAKRRTHFSDPHQDVTGKRGKGDV